MLRSLNRLARLTAILAVSVFFAPRPATAYEKKHLTDALQQKLVRNGLTMRHVLENAWRSHVSQLVQKTGNSSDFDPNKFRKVENVTVKGTRTDLSQNLVGLTAEVTLQIPGKQAQQTIVLKVSPATKKMKKFLHDLTLEARGVAIGGRLKSEQLNRVADALKEEITQEAHHVMIPQLQHLLRKAPTLPADERVAVADEQIVRYLDGQRFDLKTKLGWTESAFGDAASLPYPVRVTAEIPMQQGQKTNSHWDRRIVQNITDRNPSILYDLMRMIDAASSEIRPGDR